MTDLCRNMFSRYRLKSYPNIDSCNRFHSCSLPIQTTPNRQIVDVCKNQYLDCLARRTSMDKRSVCYHTPQRSMLSHLRSNIVPRKFSTRTKRHLQTYRQIMNRIKGHKIQYADEHVPKQVMSNVSIVYRCT